MGTVYLLGTPVLDVAEQTVSVKDVSVTAVLDNTLWSILGTIFNGQIASFIEARACYDLEPKISDLHSKLQSQLSQAAAAQHVVLVLKQDPATLRDLQLGDEALQVIIAFAGRADLVVQQISIPPVH